MRSVPKRAAAYASAGSLCALQAQESAAAMTKTIIQRAEKLGYKDGAEAIEKLRWRDGIKRVRQAIKAIGGLAPTRALSPARIMAWADAQALPRNPKPTMLSVAEQDAYWRAFHQGAQSAARTWLSATRQPGRPAKPPERKQSIELRLFLTPAQMRTLERRSASAGEDLRAFAIKLLTDEK